MPREELCECPLLRMAAEIERMTGCGIVAADGDTAMERRVTAIAVGRLRDEHGCPGPKHSVCPYYYTKYDVDLITDPNVPLLKRVKDGQDHKYL